MKRLRSLRRDVLAPQERAAAQEVESGALPDATEQRSLADSNEG
jgi:hypothetical protein